MREKNGEEVQSESTFGSLARMHQVFEIENQLLERERERDEAVEQSVSVYYMRVRVSNEPSPTHAHVGIAISKTT